MSSTIKDIARTAQVSAATVSLVLNGKGAISEETRSRVLSAASSVNYESRPARSVAKAGPAVSTGPAATVRFLKIAKHGHTVNRDHNTFISDYIDGMSRHAGESGFKLEVVSHEGKSVDSIVATIVDAQLSGVVVLGTELTEEDIGLFTATGIPLVVIDTFYDRLECDFVNMNNRDAVYKTLSHYVDRGFRHIGFIASNVQTINFRLRREAFVDGMERFGLHFDPRDIVTVDSTYEGAYQDMLGKLQAGLAVPECYVATNDIITYGCIKAFREFDIRIPQDLSIIGFDNLPMSATMDPPLTTIDVSKQTIGRLAINLLAQRRRGPENTPAIKILGGADLVVRESVLPRSRSKAVDRVR
jgi:LacI family transcriptional regulator